MSRSMEHAAAIHIGELERQARRAWELCQAVAMTPAGDDRIDIALGAAAALASLGAAAQVFAAALTRSGTGGRP